MNWSHSQVLVVYTKSDSAYSSVSLTSICVQKSIVLKTMSHMTVLGNTSLHRHKHGRCCLFWVTPTEKVLLRKYSLQMPIKSPPNAQFTQFPTSHITYLVFKNKLFILWVETNIAQCKYIQGREVGKYLEKRLRVLSHLKVPPKFMFLRHCIHLIRLVLLLHYNFASKL